MTEQTVEQMNRTIYEFESDWKFFDDDKDSFPFGYYMPEKEQDGYSKAGVYLIGAQYLKYHEDWNELHRVWEKYRDTFFGMEKEYMERKEAIATAMCYSPIAFAHRILFEAIVWINSLNK